MQECRLWVALQGRQARVAMQGAGPGLQYGGPFQGCNAIRALFTVLGPRRAGNRLGLTTRFRTLFATFRGLRRESARYLQHPGAARPHPYAICDALEPAARIRALFTALGPRRARNRLGLTTRFRTLFATFRGLRHESARYLQHPGAARPHPYAICDALEPTARIRALFTALGPRRARNRLGLTTRFRTQFATFRGLRRETARYL